MNVEEVMDKIRKAVRLANRTGEAGERETALRLARNLAAKNGIAFDDIQANECEADKAVHETEDEYHVVTGSEVGHACYILHRHFAVILMMYQSRSKRNKARFSWFGSHLNIDIAKHVYHILIRECRRSYREACRQADEILTASPMDYAVIKTSGTGKRKIDRNAYMRGFFFAIDQKLAEHPLRNDLEADRGAADRKMLEFRQNNAVRDKQQRNRKMDASSLIAGLKAGSDVNLARPCTGEDNSPLAIAM